MDPKHGSRTKYKHKPRKSTGSFEGKGDVFASLNSFTDSEHEKVNSSQVTTDDSEVSTGKFFSASAKTFKSSSFHSFHSLSSSDTPSKDDFIQVNLKQTSHVAATGSPHEVQPLTKFTKLNLLPKVECKDYHSTGAGKNSKVKPLMESPPVQTMERLQAGFDPNRIPLSIFRNKLPGNTDWSEASSESLFSIHIGNTSFSRDHVSVPKEVPQSEECETLEDVTELEEFSKPHKPTMDSRPPPIEVKESESMEEYFVVESRISQLDEVKEDTKIIDIVPAKAQNDHWKAKPPTHEQSFKFHDNANRARIKQKITPIKKNSSKCYCSSPTCEFCCVAKLRCCFCKWPSCPCCEHSNCHNCCKSPSCKWPRCGNCSKWLSCDDCCSFKCCKWPNCDSCSFKCFKFTGCKICCNFKYCNWPSCNNFCSCKSCTWPSSDNCCKWPSCCGCGICKGCKLYLCNGCGNCKCCKGLSCGNCLSYCKWPRCKCCKWPKCDGFSNCCKWPSLSCKYCNRQPSCDFSHCCKRPSCDCFSSCGCTNCCKFPNCHWPRDFCMWPSWLGRSCGRSCKWRNIFSCLPKT